MDVHESLAAIRLSRDLGHTSVTDDNASLQRTGGCAPPLKIGIIWEPGTTSSSGGFVPAASARSLENIVARFHVHRMRIDFRSA